jgi:heme oxygenase
VKKWRCIICQAQRATEERPSLRERLCEDCTVSHWRKVVAILKHGTQEQRDEANVKLKEAQAALEAYRSSYKEVKA